MLIWDQTANHKCLFISTCDQNLVKLKTHATYDVGTSNVTNYDMLKLRITQKLRMKAISNEISLISYAELVLANTEAKSPITKLILLK